VRNANLIDRFWIFQSIYLRTFSVLCSAGTWTLECDGSKIFEERITIFLLYKPNAIFGVHFEEFDSAPVYEPSIGFEPKIVKEKPNVSLILSLS